MFSPSKIVPKFHSSASTYNSFKLIRRNYVTDVSGDNMKMDGKSMSVGAAITMLGCYMFSSAREKKNGKPILPSTK